MRKPIPRDQLVPLLYAWCGAADEMRRAVRDMPRGWRTERQKIRFATWIAVLLDKAVRYDTAVSKIKAAGTLAKAKR